MKSKSPTADRAASLAKPLAPEDLCRGDYVAVLDEEQEYPAIVWFCEPPMGREHEVVRVRVRPHDPSGPLRVIEITPDVSAERLAIRKASEARRKALRPW